MLFCVSLSLLYVYHCHPQVCGDSQTTLSQHQVTRAGGEGTVPQLHNGTVSPTHLVFYSLKLLMEDHLA